MMSHTRSKQRAKPQEGGGQCMGMVCDDTNMLLYASCLICSNAVMRLRWSMSGQTIQRWAILE
jgi:hypothetical protein